MSFFQELKRRNVFRVVLGYIVLAWLVMQVADVVLNNIEAPDWVFQALLFFLALGLLFAIFFSWAFEITPEGLKRESQVDRSQSITHVTGKRLDRAIIGILVIALGYFAFDKFMISPRQTAPAPETTAHSPKESAASESAVSAPDAIPENTIAVLPFVNMSSDPEQEYFSDGLSEELLNLLAKIPQLKVASRSSAFQFKNEKIDLTEVAKKLNVAHVLEGSVRKAGNQLRITAQLIRADNGYHMWSETYDRPLDNIFAIQDEISAAVVAALKLELLGEAPKSRVVDPEAYALVLKGRFLHSKWGKDNFERAVEAYEEALRIDPDYAEAWASLSVTYLNQMQSGYRDPGEGLVLAKGAVERALALDPELPGAWARMALIRQIFEWDWQGAQSAVDRAMALDPESIYVLGAAASLASATGQTEKCLSLYDRALAVDPLNLVMLYNRADALNQLGRIDEAKAAFRRLLELNPQDWGSHTQLAILEMRSGNVEQAWKELENEVDPQQQEYGRILALFTEGRRDEANQRLEAFAEAHHAWGSALIAVMHAYADQRDQAFEWLNRALEVRDSNLAAILRDPILMPLRNDPRMDALLGEMGLIR